MSELANMAHWWQLITSRIAFLERSANRKRWFAARARRSSRWRICLCSAIWKWLRLTLQRFRYCLKAPKNSNVSCKITVKTFVAIYFETVTNDFLSVLIACKCDSIQSRSLVSLLTAKTSLKIPDDTKNLITY